MRIDRSALRAIIPDEARLRFGGDIPEEYQTDILKRFQGHAEALVYPLSVSEVSNVMRYAYLNYIPVTPRGAGTNLVGSAVPVEGGIVLDLSRMNRILEIDPSTLTAVVEPGVLLEDFQRKVESEGFFYPPDPGERASTIGGNISTNAGGMRAVKYGVTRDYVRGLQIVLADGTVAEIGGKNVKDASGLSLKNLIVGSEGTLAVITKCILRLLPKPEISRSVLVPFRDLSTGVQTVLTVLRANADPTAVEFMERSVVALGEKFCGIRYPRPDAGSYILLTFDGSAAEVERRVELVRRLVLENGAMDYIPLTDPTRAAEIWSVRGALVKAAEAASENVPLDITVPIDRTAEFAAYMDHLERATGVEMIHFGHAGDGNVHVCVMRGARDAETWQRDLKNTLNAAYSRAYALGGVVSGEHGLGVSKRPYFLQQTAAENLIIMNQIKDSLDPRHILNGQKSYIMERCEDVSGNI